MDEIYSRSISSICEQCYKAVNEANQFEAQELALQSQPIEGQLNKYTNVVKGWQYRWFVLNPNRGTLEYHMLEEKKKSHPRGCVYLAGCVISPSDEDSQTFTVSAACGEVYKLKAADAKERQFWVNKLRQVALNQENRIAAQHPPLHSSVANTVSTTGSMKSSTKSMKRQTIGGGTAGNSSSLETVRDILVQTQRYQRTLVNSIEDYTCNDEELLLMKATTYSAVMSLEQCFAILLSIQNSKLN
ncbi:oxysterol-binding protein-related protein 11-like isoform X2 [Oppia nitens]|uniref:oxysterol-binding protein-related protein 11-like isoform X2 n=1 Tax=Oppia nitens TaxID=1686743 RepID=UPI0023DC302D|nr:oxysterol-binding protein-related protein 11-like isoform X2 [Oppia nitens]